MPSEPLAAGPFRRAAADPLRPARFFAPAFAIATAVFLAAAALAALTATGQAPDLVASGPGPALELPDADHARALVVYAADPDGTALPQPAADKACELSATGTGSTARTGYPRGTGTLPDPDGTGTLHRTATVTANWRPGDTVTCPGAASLAVTAGHGPGRRLALAGMLLLGAAISAVLTALGRTSRRPARSS